MKKIVLPIAFFILCANQNAYSEEAGNSRKKVLRNSLLLAGMGGLVYEMGKDIETRDSKQTRLLSVLSIAGGIILFHNSKENTTVSLVSYQRSPALNFRMGI